MESVVTDERKGAVDGSKYSPVAIVNFNHYSPGALCDCDVVFSLEVEAEPLSTSTITQTTSYILEKRYRNDINRCTR